MVVSYSTMEKSASIHRSLYYGTEEYTLDG